MNARRLIPVACLVALLFSGPARACNIPVFRYALERWRAKRDEDFYRVLVFHRGALTVEQQAAVESLRKLGGDDTRRANFVCDLVDVSGEMAAEVSALWQAQKDAALPWVVLRYPDSDARTPTPWAGPLNEQTVRQLTDSPARKEIARRILKGDAVVWILLESGEKTADEAAAKLMQAEFARLEKLIELPEGLGEGPVKLLSEVPVRIAFSMVRVSRTDRAEQALVAMLLHSEDDLPAETGPMAFPMFGRGRALPALVDKGINADQIESMSRFLCGACSCQVKRLNPGFDLLTAVEWDSFLEGQPIPEPEETTAAGQPVPIASGVVEREADMPLSPPVVRQEFGASTLLLTGACVVGLLLLLGLVGTVVWLMAGRATDLE